MHLDSVSDFVSPLNSSRRIPCTKDVSARNGAKAVLRFIAYRALVDARISARMATIFSIAAWL